MSSWSMSPGDFRYVFMAGLRAQVTPEGDCRECTFQAQGQGLGLHPLDAVTIYWDGQPIFYGEVRIGGNPYDKNGHQLTLRSLALRLKEVTIPDGWTAPQQKAGLTIRSLINAVLPQLGGTIMVGQIDDFIFNCREIKNAQQQNPYALLEQIATDGAAMNVKVRFGVNARREFFCVVAREDEIALNNDMMTGQTHWVAPVAEAPVTAVRWFVQKRPDGGWLTHLSRAAEADVYGERVKPEALESRTTGDFWEIAGMTLSSNAGEGVSNLIVEGLATRPATAQDAYDILTDTIELENSLRVKAFASILAAKEEVESLYLSGVTQGDRLIVSADAIFENRADTGIETKSGKVRLSINGEAITLLPNRSSYVYYGPIHTVNLEVDLTERPTIADWAAYLVVGELRIEKLKRDSLDSIAHFHYNIPATAPADLELRDFTNNRAGRVTYNGWQSPVDAYEYRLTAARGMTTGILAGQADDPNKLAQAALIKRRDNLATIAAITSNV